MACLPVCLGYHSGTRQGVPPYQVVDLVVPPAGHEHHLASFLCDFQWWAAVLKHGALVAIQEFGGSHIIWQATMAIPQGFFLPWWEEEPLFPPTDVDRPAEGTENVGMER